MAKIAPPPPPNTFIVKGLLRMCPNMKFLFTLNAYVVQVKKHLSTGVLSVRPSLLFNYLQTCLITAMEVDMNIQLVPSKAANQLCKWLQHGIHITGCLRNYCKSVL